MAKSQSISPGLTRIATFVLVVSTLYFARAVLIPIALAVLLSFILAPVVNRLERMHLPRVPSILLVSVCAFALIGSIGYFATQEVLQLAESLPRYRENIKQRVEMLQGGMTNGKNPIGEAAEMVQEIQKEVEKQTGKDHPPAGTEGSDLFGPPLPAESQPEEETPDQPDQDVQHQPDKPQGRASSREAWIDGREPTDTPAEPREQEDGELSGEQNGEQALAETEPGAKPIPVEIHAPPPSTIELIQGYLSPLMGPLATAGIVIVFVIFFLLAREDMRDRVIRLAGAGRLNVTTQALNEAGSRISRYLLMQLTINASYGIPVGIALWFIGVPGALLWGLLATLLRFIPYIGPWMGALMPIVMALAVFDGWTWPLIVIGFFICLELFSNNVMEPWLYGASTGMSPVAVLIAAVFWSWLWGPVGLLLAVPLTACFVVLGRHVQQLEFLTILLGNQPVLPPSTKFYQRVLAMQQEEALEMAEQHRSEHGLISLYENVVVPALHLEERDRHRGNLTEQRETVIRDSVREITEELGQWEDEKRKQQATQNDDADEADASASHTGPELIGPPVLCIPARDEADELTAEMFAQVLRSEGYQAEPLDVEHLAGEMIRKVQELKPNIVCVSAMPPSAVTQGRYLCKRLDSQVPYLRIIAGLWDWRGDVERATNRLFESGADHVVTTFTDALEVIKTNVTRV